jgi:outer membrane receptor protein involved in Fe transport
MRATTPTSHRATTTAHLHSRFVIPLPRIRSLLLLAAGLTAMPVVAAGQDTPRGIVTGRVVDRATGRPVAGAVVTIVALGDSARTNLDGRYLLADIPAGTYSARAAAIGLQRLQVDNIAIIPGQTTTVDFALGAVVFELAGIVVEAEVVDRPATDAALLQIQQSAPAVSDGISAEMITRAPDSDAADAITRVTGVSVQNDKFVVIRGLPERYSNTLLNGSELPSPEPLRRVVPLDIFPASLLESIVTSKAATPDRPGDFAGGSIEIRTKEFPESFVLQGSLTAGYNSVATFEDIPLVPLSGWSLLGFSTADRRTPQPALEPGEADEAFGEEIRNVWSPRPRWASPEVGGTFNLGGQLGEGIPLGYAIAATYKYVNHYNPDRLFAIYNDFPSENVQPVRSLVYDEGATEVDWGTIANLSYRLGGGSKLGFKNVYTRNARELALTNDGYDTENSRVIRSYQVGYVEQDLFQTQLSGEHLLPWLLDSRFEWRGTWAQARRDETDNRQAQYVLSPQTGEYSQATTVPTRGWVRLLTDVTPTGQLDLAVPFTLRQPSDGQFKMGYLIRQKHRDFDAQLYSWLLDNQATGAVAIAKLPPEEAFAPENVGTVFRFERTQALAQPYTADDDVWAGYGMLDFPLVPWLRLVGGVRYELWRLTVTPGADTTRPDLTPTFLRTTDWLWSANATVRLSEKTNIRLAGYSTVSRPDAREVSPDAYTAISGECDFAGNPEVQPTDILNGDLRFEVYPRAGEILALSAFYKKFDQPIIEFVQTPGGGQCRYFFGNGEEATNYGAEFEVRKGLGPLFAGFNILLVESRVSIDTALGNYDPELPLQGQSPFLLNANLSFAPAGSRFEITVLGNYYANRIVRYGQLFGEVQGPNTVEEGRFTLDAKLRVGFGAHLGVTLSGRNLTGEDVTFVNEGPEVTAVVGGARPGTDLKLGISYDF